ncbi:MAG TPA: ATP-dependent DNA helicase RecG, partial [Dehalococcoidia bacterium]|nr:ATP-dependent DNA helicase RecG [Dehalococcoidia bacterium]
MNRFARPQTPARQASNARPPARTATSRQPAGEAVLRFHKVLELELRRGCDDGAVIGGIDRFLPIASQDRSVAAVLTGAPALEQGYHALAPRARETWLRAVLNAKPVAKSKAKGSGDAPAKVAPRPVTKPEAPGDPLDQPVTVIRGIKAGLQARLAKLDVQTVRQLLYLFPNRHNDFANVSTIAELQPDEEQTTLVSVWSSKVARLGRRPGTEAVVGDGTGTMRVVWFNQPYLSEQLKTNDRIVLAGKVGVFNRLKTMENPEWEAVPQGDTDGLTHTGRLVPVYPLTQGLSQRILRRAVKEAVDRFAQAVKETLPAEMRQRLSLPNLGEALRQMHYPDTREKHEEARRRLAFDELLAVQIAVLERRLAWQDGRAPALSAESPSTGSGQSVLETYRSALPFSLTGAQERVLGDILGDIARTRPMARLLQGDVGSGKTAVAAAAMAVAAANGFQGAIMAPTEILAEQHFRTLSALLAKLQVTERPLRVELLVGSLTPSAKRGVAEAVASGEIDFVVGTHALIQEGVSFHRLGVAVVDEQHRFGVMQRAALRERIVQSDGPTPHLLVMSATPIPRTLALTFFGDLDVSVIDEMPPGRLQVATRWIGPDERSEAYGFVRDQVAEGRQAFVVCPLIEESATLQTRSATQEFERLSSYVFPELRLGLLHGRMASAEKDSVLQAFRRGELDILVATTVIEVGIDIPNASVMLIEGADRFGLAQLHQLRGRVGRGAAQSYCLLLSDDPSQTARARLQLMEDLSDGFALAEADL